MNHRGLFLYTGPFIGIVATFAALLAGLGLMWWLFDLGKRKPKRGPRRKYTFDERGHLQDQIPRCPVCQWEAAPLGNWTALDRHIANTHPLWRPPHGL